MEKLYAPLARAFNRVHAFVDNRGDDAFQQSFVSYIRKNHQPTLFSDFNIEFQDDEANRGIQLCDFIAGSLARYFDEGKRTANGHELIDLLRASNKLIALTEWPEAFEHYAEQLVEQQPGPHDTPIAEYNIKTTDAFIENNLRKKDDNIRTQVTTARLLLGSAIYGDPTEYIASKRIANHIEAKEGIKVSDRLGRDVINALKYEGIMIASNRSGYKLVINETDLVNFVDYYDSFLRGMLKKIEISRNQAKLATKNSLDILDFQNFSYLKNFFEAQENSFLDSEDVEDAIESEEVQ